MAIGLDTSVVLRLLTGKPAAQTKIARRRLELAHRRGEAVLVTDLVVAEANFALQHHYGISQSEARRKLRAMLESGVVELSPSESIWALDDADGAGLVDRLIHARHLQDGAISLTFDRRMAALEGATKLDSV